MKKQVLKKSSEKFVAEVNRPINDNIKRALKALKQHGIKASLVGHLTSLKLVKPQEMTFSRFLKIVRSIIQPNGQAFLHSQTGRSYIVDFWGHYRVM